MTNNIKSYTTHQNFLLFIFSLIFSVMGFLIFKEINAIKYKVHSLSLTCATLSSQNTEIISKVFKLQKKLDEKVITLEAHPVLPVNLSTEDTILLIKLALILIICGFSIWYCYAFIKIFVSGLLIKDNSIPVYLNKLFESIFVKFELKSFQYRDKFDNIFTIHVSESTKTAEIWITPATNNNLMSLESYFEERQNALEAALATIRELSPIINSQISSDNLQIANALLAGLT